MIGVPSSFFPLKFQSGFRKKARLVCVSRFVIDLPSCLWTIVFHIISSSYVCAWYFPRCVRVVYGLVSSMVNFDPYFDRVQACVLIEKS